MLTGCGDTHNLFHSLFIKSCGCHINFVGGFMSETLDLLGKPEWISLVNHSAALMELEEQDLFKTMTSHWPCMTVITCEHRLHAYVWKKSWALFQSQVWLVLNDRYLCFSGKASSAVGYACVYSRSFVWPVREVV